MKDIGCRFQPTTGTIVAMNTPSPAPLSRRLSVAPMMDCTDRHTRRLHRLISRCTLLYTCR